MGTSYVEFRSRGFFLHDAHLELLLHLLSKEADRVSAAPEWLHEAKLHWRQQSVIGATGCVWPDFDDRLTSPDRVALVLGFAEKVHQDILARSTPLSEEAGINGLGRPVHFMGDIPKTWAVQGVEALIKLLKGELLFNDGSLKLPKIEFYEKIAPKDPALRDIAQLWLKLEHERFSPEPGEVVFERLAREPWESDDPRIKSAWQSLTAPENLQALERWVKAIGLNPVSFHAAGAWAEKALAECRTRQGKVPGS